MNNLFFIFLFFFSCARTPHHDELPALLIDDPPELISDDLPLVPFIEGLKDQIAYHKKLSSTWISFGEYQVKRTDYIQSLEELINSYNSEMNLNIFINLIEEKFTFLSVYGDRFPSDILLTSYYEPLIQGSKIPTKRFSQPIYRYPDDLIEIDLSSFIDDGAIIGEAKRRLLIGKASSNKNIRENAVITPYYTRAEIDEAKVLSGRNLEICYLDPIDTFFLQIQGSGTIELDTKEKIRVGYAGSNGRAYHSIGKFLYHAIPLEEMSADKIEFHLRSLTLSESQKIMNQNPSYVFFREIMSEPITTNNTEVISGRTLATDSKYFSKGLFAYLYFQKPFFADNQSEFKLDWQGRFVLDQDTGGAIKGVRRADLFWGQGPVAKKHAGVMRHEARLYYLAPKAFLVKKQ